VNSLRGIIHGNVIELDEAPNLPDGHAVTIIIQPADDFEPLAPGDGIRRSAGGWADDQSGLDEYLALTRQQRTNANGRVERQSAAANFVTPGERIRQTSVPPTGEAYGNNTSSSSVEVQFERHDLRSLRRPGPPFRWYRRQ